MDDHQDMNRIIMNPMPPGLSILSDEEEDIGDEPYITTDLLSGELRETISTVLAGSGTIPGLAAAAALASSHKRHCPYKFEINPTIRKRQHTRLIRKLKQTIHELCTRCGQQAVVLCVSPGKENPNFRVFGSSPLDRVVKNCRDVIFSDLESELQQKYPQNTEDTSEQFELPPLTVEGLPTTVDKMNQAQLRMFIPEMLKYSTGRGKPGWGREHTRPVWWPQDVPWANVRRDDRTQERKSMVSWTQALRQIVRNCYSYHNREDLLFSNFSREESQGSIGLKRDKLLGVHMPGTSATMSVTSPTLVQTIHNADGSVSLIQLDSGQTIATIHQDQSGAAVATLTNEPSVDNRLEMTMEDIEAGNWPLDNQPDNMVESFSVITSSDVTSKNGNSLSLPFSSNEQMINEDSMERNDDVTIATDDVSSAMVQIPVSVYEKIANSINEQSGAGSVSISSDGRIHLTPDFPGLRSPSKSAQLKGDRSRSLSAIITREKKAGRSGKDRDSKSDNGLNF